ncbi:hypothetical protein DFS34DRAFT_594462 [Phlyctochytrium arcticum]|nr:hypothetical protein DFS34DRAFT_594462 [Phlyctochytrium arcticum]
MVASLTITLTPDHGWAIATATASVFVLSYFAFKAGGMRKKAGVPYPYLYADRAEAEASPVKKLYNCYQRAHQNTLENYPAFLALLATSSIEYPRFAAACGATWLIGRITYAHGYYSGQPERRNRGAFAYLGWFGMIGASFKVAYDLIMS